MPISLLPRRQARPFAKEVNRVLLLPLSQIRRNPLQPRRHFDAEALGELTESIAANGLLQPVTVRRLEEGGYELIAGERRAMAYRSLGRDSIPAIIEDCSDRQSAAFALIENLQRADLNFFEEAEGIARLMGELGLSQQQVSAKLGKAQSTVANKLRLLRYPPELQDTMLVAGLTERHARALLRVQQPDKLKEAVAHVISQRYNVEQTEQYLSELLQDEQEPRPIRRYFIKDMRIFRNTIQKAVRMMNEAGIGVICQCSESDDAIEYQISVPKQSVLQTKPPESFP